MGTKAFDIKSFWMEMKELFPDIDLNSIREDTKEWTSTTKPIVLKRLL